MSALFILRMTQPQLEKAATSRRTPKCQAIFQSLINSLIPVKW